MLQDVLKNINKEFKKELAIKGIGELKIKRIPFTSPRLNYSTYGGVPRGRVSMFAGKESSGKSTTALDIVKNAQIIFQKEWEEEVANLESIAASRPIKENMEKLNYIKKRGPLQIVYFDAEGTIDSEWAAKIGIDIDNIWLVRLHTQTAEQFLDQVLKVVSDTDDVGLIVIDSIAVLVPQLVHGESLEQKNMGGNAKVVTDFVNKVCPVLGEKDIACIIINQARDDFKNPYSEFSIPCGNGLKLASSLTLTFQKGRLLDEDGKEQTNSFDRPQGNLVWVRIQKTKVCKPDRRVGFYALSYDYGIDDCNDLVDLSIENYGLMKRSGSWFYLLDPNTNQVAKDEEGNDIKFQGKTSMVSFLRENKELYEYIKSYINDRILGKEPVVDITISKDRDKQAIQECNDYAEQQDMEILENDEQ